MTIATNPVLARSPDRATHPTEGLLFFALRPAVVATDRSEKRFRTKGLDSSEWPKHFAPLGSTTSAARPVNAGLALPPSRGLAEDVTMM